MWWMLLIIVAFGAKPQADQLEAEWRSLQFLQADPDRYRIVREPITIRDGPLEVVIETGVLVPIFSAPATPPKNWLRPR